MSFALYLLFLCLTYLRPVEVFAPELVAYRPMLIMSLLTFFTSLGHYLSTKQSAARAQHARLLIGLMATIALSQIFTGYFGGAIISLMDFSSSAILFCATVWNVTDMRRLRISCAVVAVCASLLGVASIAAYHTGFMVDKLVLRQNGSDEDEAVEPDPSAVPAEDTSGKYLWRVRSFGFFSDPNDFAQVLVVSIPMLLGLYAKRRFIRNAIVIGIPGAALGYTIYLTHSRGALLGVASLLFFGVKRALGTVKTIVMLGGMFVAASLLNFTGGRAYTANEESAGGRIDAWSEGIKMVTSHPLFGVGYRNFVEHHQYTAHNSFVLCFSEIGLLGYFTWMGMLIVVFKKINEAESLAPLGSDEQRWAGLLRSSLVGFLTCAIFLSRAFEPVIYIVMALCIVAAHCTEMRFAEVIPQLSVRPKWMKLSAWITVGSVVLVYFIVVIKNSSIGRSI